MNSAGSISIAGVVVLESPRAVDPQKGPRHVVFDASFCIVQETETVTLSLLRYFASTEMATEIQKMADKPYQKAFVVANVCISPTTWKLNISSNINILDRFSRSKHYLNCFNDDWLSTFGLRFRRRHTSGTA